MILIALAAQLAAPTPQKFTSWFSPDDMPGYVERGVISRRSLLRWTIQPDSAVQSCDVTQGSGDSRVDSFSCELVLKRGHYNPARWTDGTPVHGVVEFPINWYVGDNQPQLDPQLIPQFTVDNLPRGSKSPAFIFTALAVSDKGAIIACGAGPTQYPGRSDPEILVKIACTALVESYHPVIVKDINGLPVRSVQTRSVEFVKAPR
ncbi:MAG: hypothetical protein ABIO68_05180 [Sphingomicrobium sp.]